MATQQGGPPLYGDVPSHVAILQSRPPNRVVIAAAEAHLQQLAKLAPHLEESEIGRLTAQFPLLSKQLSRSSGNASSRPTSDRRKGASGTTRLPQIHGGKSKASPRFSDQVAGGGQHKGSSTSVASHAADATAVDVSTPRAGELPQQWLAASMASGAEAEYVPGFPQPPPLPAPVMSPGGGSEVGLAPSGRGKLGPRSRAAAVSSEKLWEENPAILAPSQLLRGQPLPLLVQRREQALDGLRGLLHSLSRVRGAAHKLPVYVAGAYQARLQHAIGWYRVTTTELVERIMAQRKESPPVLKKTHTGEWRHVHEPYLVDGANALLLIGRVDLAFAPLPVAADPLLLLWFSSSSHQWVSDETIPVEMLLPQSMHSLLELARMQRCHEVLLAEAQLYGLSPLPTVYEPRDNVLGVTCELLLYGSATRYSAIARRFRAALHLLYIQLDASRVISRMLRGWMARSQLKMYKAALKVQAVYKLWKKRASQRAIARTGHSALEEGGSVPPPSKPISFADAAAFKVDEVRWERASKLIARGRKFHEAQANYQSKGKGASLFDVVKNANSVNTTLNAASKLTAMLKHRKKPAAAAPEVVGDDDSDLTEEEKAIRDAATRIQAKIRGVNAQKLVFSLAEAGEEMIEKVRNPRGVEAVASVTKAFRARNAFTMLLLKAFKQRQMAIVMQGGDDTPTRRTGVPEAAFRMAVEAVRERTMQGLLPAEADLQTKIGHHREHVSVQAEFQRATARLQFWEALKSGVLPAHLSTLAALEESSAIARAEAYLKALVAQRALPLPEGMTPTLHVSRLVGSVKAIQELVDSCGAELHELEPLERQLRAHLAHMGVTDPASQEAPPPIASNAGRAMLPTAASMNRANAMQNAMQNGMQPQPPPGSGAASGAGRRAPPRRRSVTVAGGGGSGGGGASAGGGGATGAQDPGSPASKADGAAADAADAPPKASGEVLEDAISAAQAELTRLEEVRELLVELRATDAPPRYQPKLAREVEAKRELLADQMRRVHDIESQHEHLSHFCAQARGSLDLLEAADAFDFCRQRARLRGEAAQYGIQSMHAMRGETKAKRLQARSIVVEAMQSYLEQELPVLEKRARERVEAVAKLHLTVRADLVDESVQQAIVEDVEDWLGFSFTKAPNGNRVHYHSVVAAPSPPSSSYVTVNVLEGAGRPVDELLKQLATTEPRRGWNSTRKTLVSTPAFIASMGQVDPAAIRLDSLSVQTMPSHIIVHDSRTLADRKREIEEALVAARSELRPLQAKELAATAAQAQLWKLDGVEDALAQCQNPRLLALKASERENKPKLAELAHDAEVHIERFSEAQAKALELEGRVEALTRLMACAAAEEGNGNGGGGGGGGGGGSTDASMRKSKEAAGRSKGDAQREYSTNAFREVAQQILRERRQQDHAVRLLHEEGTPLSSNETSRRKYQSQGALQLLKTLHNEERDGNPSEPPRAPPSPRLIALSRFLRRNERDQREAIKMMAREGARIASASAAAQPDGNEPGGHWAQMKAMIQMTPRSALVDDSIFDEFAVARAADEMGVQLRSASGDGSNYASGLACLPLVLYFMRAPLPFPFEEQTPPPQKEAEAAAAAAAAAAASKRPTSRQRESPEVRRGGGGSGLRGKVAAVAAAPASMHANAPAAHSRTSPRLVYQNMINNKMEERHPLRHVYARLAKRAERVAFKRSTPDATSPEAWMEFVDSSGTPYYYCFLTNQYEWEFPRLQPIGQLGLATKTTASTHAMRFKKRMLQQPARRLSPGSLEAMRLNGEAEQHSKPRRAGVLKKMPLAVSHIVFTAQYLGIDTLTQTHFMWIASAALCDMLGPTMPVGWESRHVPADAGASAPLSHYYYNTSLHVSQWEHPSLTHWRSVLAELVAFERQQLGAAAHLAASDALGKARPMLWAGEAWEDAAKA